FRDSKANVLDKIEDEVPFAIGSGARGRSYIISRKKGDQGGFLYQSPISWFTRGDRWDISPGYEGFNVHYDKAIHPACLFCHANQAEPVPYAQNQYREPIFRGYSIGCERCHGPGELHVASAHKLEKGEIDYTIVNPKHLEPTLREAVCQQCHLQ